MTNVLVRPGTIAHQPRNRYSHRGPFHRRRHHQCTPSDSRGRPTRAGTGLPVDETTCRCCDSHWETPPPNTCKLAHVIRTPVPQRVSTQTPLLQFICRCGRSCRARASIQSAVWQTGPGLDHHLRSSHLQKLTYSCCFLALLPPLETVQDVKKEQNQGEKLED